MQWSDEALILDVSNYGEHAAIVHVFSKHHGRYNAISKAARASKQRAIYQPGNLVEATWKARLEEHMGSLSCELVQSLAAMVMHDNLRLCAMMSLCSLLKQTLPERDPHAALYETARNLALAIVHVEPALWQALYARFEWVLLSHCGIGLDVSQCVATGVRENLVYVSPKSGRAVSKEAGAPYHEKLLHYPAFLQAVDEFSTSTVSATDDKETSHHEVLQALTLTGYFLEHWWATPHQLELPAARKRFVSLLRRQ